MTHNERVKVCSLCTNRTFNPKLGVVCGLTGEQPTFDVECSHYNSDPIALHAKELQMKQEQYDENATVNKGRLVLFGLGLIYVIYGVFEGFIGVQAQLAAGIIDFSIAAVFFLLGFWSLKKPFAAMVFGLGFFGFMIILLAVIEPITLVQGIYMKIIVVTFLVFGMSSARKQELVTTELKQ